MVICSLSYLGSTINRLGIKNNRLKKNIAMPIIIYICDKYVIECPQVTFNISQFNKLPIYCLQLNFLMIKNEWFITLKVEKRMICFLNVQKEHIL